jgi:hypothetical protein
MVLDVHAMIVICGLLGMASFTDAKEQSCLVQNWVMGVLLEEH